MSNRDEIYRDDPHAILQRSQVQRRSNTSHTHGTTLYHWFRPVLGAILAPMGFVRWAKRYRRQAVVWPVVLRQRHGLRSPAGTIHATYARQRGDRARSSPSAARPKPSNDAAPGRPSRGTATTWFVYDVLAMSVQMLARHGRWVSEDSGVPRWRQWLEMIWLAVWLPSMPENYYKFEWYRPEVRRRAAGFLHRYEMKNHVYRLLAPGNGAVSLWDKEAFAAHAHRCGLPIVRTLATARGGRFAPLDGQSSIAWQRDLFIKPIEGKGGKGADCLTYQAGPPSAFRSVRSSTIVPVERLGEHVAALCAHKRYARGALIQVRLENHPELKPLAGEPLSTCRIVTILDERGEPEPVIAIFRIAPHDAAIVDNSHAGGMAAPVDMNTGVLGEAAYVRHDGVLARYARKESTGAAIAGARLPCWREVVDLALRAHRAFLPWVLIGWDIAITPDGPVLVEANDQPCTDGLQRRHRLPLGNHRFGELVAHHLVRLGAAGP